MANQSFSGGYRDQFLGNFIRGHNMVKVQLWISGLPHFFIPINNLYQLDQCVNGNIISNIL
jgi:hypothetical protein